MKIAYLISAHTDPKQLSRLIGALRIHDCTQFFVHLDAKANYDDFAYIGSAIDVRFCKSRHNVSWGGYSQCLYQRELIDECLASGDKYDRVFFISGLDYPIWSNKKILDELRDHPDKQYIMGVNISSADASPKQRHKICSYHLFRDAQVANPFIKKWLNRFVYRLLTPMIDFFVQKNPYIEFEGKQIPVFYGSSWWCLTHECMKHIQPIINSDAFERFFKTAYCPDELMIQTAVFNSPFAQHTIPFCINGEKVCLADLTPLHYIEYGAEIKVFGENDLTVLLKSGKMFFRKARTSISDSLLDKIDSLRE